MTDAGVPSSLRVSFLGAQRRGGLTGNRACEIVFDAATRCYAPLAMTFSGLSDRTETVSDHAAASPLPLIRSHFSSMNGHAIFSHTFSQRERTDGESIIGTYPSFRYVLTAARR